VTDPFAGDHYEALQVSPRADDDTIQCLPAPGQALPPR